MISSYELKIMERCLCCASRTENGFCAMSMTALKAFDRIKIPYNFRKNVVLFLEGQPARGIFVLCKGQVKLSLCAGDGKTCILNVAKPSEALGLSAVLSGSPYEFTAETLEPCEVNFVKDDDFVRFLRENPEACFQITKQLGLNYYNACHEIRSLGLSHSAGEKLAKLLLEFTVRDADSHKADLRVRLPISQDEIAQMIGCCRETVTRLFADLRRRGIGECRRSVLLIHDKHALKALADNRIAPLRVAPPSA